MGRYNTSNGNQNGDSTSLIVIILLIVSIIGLVGWLLYKTIQGIAWAIADRKRQKQNKPIVV